MFLNQDNTNYCMRKIVVLSGILFCLFILILAVGCAKDQKYVEPIAKTKIPTITKSVDKVSSKSTSVNKSTTVQFYNEDNQNFFCSEEKADVPYSCDKKCFIKIYNYNISKTDPLVSPYSLNPWTNLEHTRELIDNLAHKNISKPQRVKIVFYGQSITDSRNLWVINYLPNSLIEKYGDIFDFSIKSRGGWSSTYLYSVYYEDIEPADPDLVIIQDYNDYADGSYEALLFEGCNNKTKVDEWFSEISLSGNFSSIKRSDYEDNLGKPGIRQMVNSRGNNVEVLLLSNHYSIPNTKGSKSNDCMSFVVYPSWANEHKLGFVDLRVPWINYVMNKYSSISDSAASNLLIGGKHLSGEGQELYAKIVLKYFEIDFENSTEIKK